MEKLITLPPSSDPGAALAAVVALRLMADKLERNAVAEALKQGWTWTEIAQALGVTKQAAHKRLAPSAGHSHS
ncbi:MAG: helix-turn-helix domain-containing protein [Rubrivivax sp.]|nr:MAG: helix-turn-helix domain-containing protein [Rubrivivax sp.]